MKKLTKGYKESLNKTIGECILIISLAILLTGIHIFWVGFHNLDLCHNEISLENQINEDLDELGFDGDYSILEKKVFDGDYSILEKKVFDGEVWSLDDCYLLGLRGIIEGFYISIVGAFMLGYIIVR